MFVDARQNSAGADDHHINRAKSGGSHTSERASLRKPIRRRADAVAKRQSWRRDLPRHK